MIRVAFLALPLLIAGCAEGPLATSPPATAEARAPVAEPQPSAELRDTQQRLRALGLYDGPLDGLHGPETQRAIERFQRDHGLAVTARLDSPTRAAIRAEEARSAEPLALSERTDVRTVQNRLRQLGFYDGPADGVWGQRVQHALERFQHARGLPVGDVTRTTLRAMDLDADAFRVTAAPAAGIGEPVEPVVVRAVQQRLRQMGFEPGPVDGVWGPGTQAALERFQRSRGLETSGTLTPTTAAALGLDPNDLRASAAAITRGEGPRARR